MMNGQGVSSDATVLQVEKLCFGYGQRELFSLFSAQFQPGVTWVKGSNGSGKSTLLKLLAGVLQPISGHVEMPALRLDAATLEYRRRMFWCGPGPLAFDHLTPLEYLGFIRGLYRSFSVESVAGHVSGFALEPHLQSPLRDLSTGTQRKVWLTAALCTRAPVTLLDEPLNALDKSALSYLQAALGPCVRQTEGVWIIASHDSFGPASLQATVLDLGAPL